MPFHNLPPREDLLTLRTEDVAGYLLIEIVRQWRTQNASQQFGHPQGITFAAVFGWSEREDEQLFLVLAEAWSWLIREGLLVPFEPKFSIGGTGQVVPSRRARELKDIEVFRRLRDQEILPRTLLHPALKLIGVQNDFLIGQYDISVAKAFQHIEKTVKAAIGAPPELIGVELMRKAFRANGGPLADSTLPTGEANEWPNLFASAMAVYRNSTTHREVGLTPEETVEILVFASHLLRVVDRRIAGIEKPTGS